MGFQGEQNKQALVGIRGPLKLFSSFIPDSWALPRYCRLVLRLERLPEKCLWMCVSLQCGLKATSLRGEPPFPPPCPTQHSPDLAQALLCTQPPTVLGLHSHCPAPAARCVPELNTHCSWGTPSALQTAINPQIIPRSQASNYLACHYLWNSLCCSSSPGMKKGKTIPTIS